MIVCPSCLSVPWREALRFSPSGPSAWSRTACLRCGCGRLVVGSEGSSFGPGPEAPPSVSVLGGEVFEVNGGLDEALRHVLAESVLGS